MSWAHYLLQVNIYLIVFYAFYRLLLENESYFQLNRIYLLATGLLAFGIPFIRIEWLTQQSANQQVSVTISNLDMMVMPDHSSGGFASIPWGSIIAIIYVAGLLFFFTRFCLQLYTINRAFRKLSDQSDGFKDRSKIPGSEMAYSFFRHKFVHQDLPGSQTIHKHEDIHIRQLHTLDVLFFEVIALLNWFNPVVYLFKTAVKNNHEFLADEVAADYQGNRETYALLLLSAAFKVSPHALTNSFFSKQSLIKKRIYMLHKEKSRGAAILKYGLYLPLFSGVLLLSSATLRQNEALIELSRALPLEDPLNAVKESLGGSGATNSKASSLSPAMAQSVATSLQEWEPFYEFVGRSLKYHEQAIKQQIHGNTQTKFTLENGAVKGLEVLTKLGADLDAEVMKAILSYKDFKGQPDGNYVLNVTFKLQGASTAMKNETINPVEGYTNLKQITIIGLANAIAGAKSNQSGVMDFASVDTPPSFPGGIKEFYSFIGRTIKYPAEAVKNKVQGKVFLSYVVEKDGTLNDVQLAGKLLGSGTDEEAVRVLKLSPRWNPGLVDGKPVRVKYHIPISFSLSKEDAAVEIPLVVRDSAMKAGFKSVQTIKESKEKVYKINGVLSTKEAVEKLNSNDIESINVEKADEHKAIININTKK